MAKFSKLAARKADLLLLAGVLLFTLLSSELALRYRGYPSIPFTPPFKLEPPESIYVKHPTRGYTHRPGAWTVTLGDGYAFRITHNTEGYRITRPPSSEQAYLGKPGIWLFGCSFTHGWSVSDEETFAWRLQAALPQYDVRNFGVEGYGTVSALETFREEVKKRPRPELVILGHGDFHAQRNILTVRRGLSFNRMEPFPRPYALLSAENRLEIKSAADPEYDPLPFTRQIAIMNFAESLKHRWQERRLRIHEVTLRLLGEFAEVARAQGVTFLLGGLTADDETEEVLATARGLGIETVDMALDIWQPGALNHPHDGHPGPQGHRVYAEKLTRALQKRLSGLALAPR